MFTRLPFDRLDPNDDEGFRRSQTPQWIGSRSAAASDKLYRADVAASGDSVGSLARWNETMLEELLAQVSLPEGMLARLRQSVDEWAN